MRDQLPGVHAAPNIQSAPDIYEIENLAVDPEQLIEAAMWRIHPWQDQVVVDLGAGTGFHVPRFHTHARHVIAVEPHAPSRLSIMQRVIQQQLEQVSILHGSAEHLRLPDHSVDVIHARFAYFFAPGCTPGIRELERVMRPGGTAFIIDNDLEHGTFAQWLKRHQWQREPFPAICQFWSAHGFTLTRIPSRWEFQNRADLEAVVHLEFGDTLGATLLAEHTGLTVDYHYALFHRTF